MTTPDLNARMMELVGLDSKLHVNSPPSYTTDWARTGPLLERYKVRLVWLQGVMGHESLWSARVSEYSAHDESPLVAVCKVLLMCRDRGVL